MGYSPTTKVWSDFPLYSLTEDLCLICEFGAEHLQPYVDQSLVSFSLLGYTNIFV